MFQNRIKSDGISKVKGGMGCIVYVRDRCSSVALNYDLLCRTDIYI
jgi:hypothetical protein